jgi:hypothetical protein
MGARDVPGCWHYRGGRRMSGFAAIRSRYDSRIVRRVSGWEQYYLLRSVLADFACAIGSLARAESCSGSATVRGSPQLGARLGLRPLDELPQRFNVHPGGMPPLGREPDLPDEVAKSVGHIRAAAGQGCGRSVLGSQSGVHEQMPADRAVCTESQT